MAQAKVFAKPSATVVVPAGLRWSVDAAGKAGDKNAFIRVGGDKVSARFLSGAQRSWGSDDPAENRTVFHLALRISGTPENISAALKYAGFPDDEIKGFLVECITKDNYNTTKKAEFDEEVDRHKNDKSTKPVTDQYDWPEVLWFAENIKSAKIENKKSAPKFEAGGATTVKTRLAPGSSLKDRVEKLPDGNLLDVSEMTHDFKGVKTKPTPKTTKSNKYYSEGLPFMTNDLDRYIKAIKHVYGDEGAVQYSKNIDEVRQKLAGLKAPVVNHQTGAVIPQPTQSGTKPIVAIPVPNKATVPTAVVPKVKSPRVQGAGAFPNLPQLK